MSTTTYYEQECPTCGRMLRVRVSYLGKSVVCQHCHARFGACDPQSCDPQSAAYASANSGIALLKRADELLESVAARKIG